MVDFALWDIVRNLLQAARWTIALSLIPFIGGGLVGMALLVARLTKSAIAPTVGFLVQVIKGTALASVIGFVELTKAGAMITNATFRPFLVYSCVALLYFALCFPVSWYAKRLERSLRAPS